MTPLIFKKMEKIIKNLIHYNNLRNQLQQVVGKTSSTYLDLSIIPDELKEGALDLRNTSPKTVFKFLKDQIRLDTEQLRSRIGMKKFQEMNDFCILISSIDLKNGFKLLTAELSKNPTHILLLKDFNYRRLKGLTDKQIDLLKASQRSHL